MVFSRCFFGQSVTSQVPTKIQKISCLLNHAFSYKLKFIIIAGAKFILIAKVILNGDTVLTANRLTLQDIAREVASFCCRSCLCIGADDIQTCNGCGVESGPGSRSVECEWPSTLNPLRSMAAIFWKSKIHQQIAVPNVLAYGRAKSFMKKLVTFSWRCNVNKFTLFKPAVLKMTDFRIATQNNRTLTS